MRSVKELTRGFVSSLRKCHVVAQQNLVPRIGVIGAPFGKGQRKHGVEEAPAALRKTGFIARLTELGNDVVDYGDVREATEQAVNQASGPDGERFFHRVLQYNEKLALSTCNVIKDNRVCLTIGGDHSVAVGTITGHQMALPDGYQVTVLWIDAHADINTHRSSPSGNMHGMAVSYLMSNLPSNRLPNGFPSPCLTPHDLAYLGIRDLDPEEQAYIRNLGIKAFRTKDIDKLGITEVIDRCIDHLQPSSRRPLHVSFDIDVLDPTLAPATGTPVYGGLSVREACSVMEAVVATGHASAIDMVEINPLLSDSKGNNDTVQSAKTIIMSALANHRGT